ncbi:MFS transporter [Mycolicibacterium litorale]|uniref:MFS transporter n=2 Tax=Candidatus Mycolicibacterium alkanivorans TaxID=2954114 RepID=A0ABS9YRH9_9MYCO|nr:MFS transporter [Candidatus Mycolicibacterium alkanivorans]MCI4673851.1 MFS transporter [Candidatus Mycolicibacterium alkanivorans]
MRTSPWTPRVTTALAVLAAAAFVYVTAEIMPVGALPAIARDLRVSEALVGTLLAAYALVAAVSTVPLVRWTATWPRRRALLFTLVSLAVSQLISALAPTFAVLAMGRVLCALTHGLMWSVIAPIGVRLVPPSYAARATAAVYVGTGLALVVGNPLTAAMSELWGWRLAVGAITAAAVAVMLAARFTLPAMPMTGAVTDSGGGQVRHHRNRRLVMLSVLTLVGVTGHFISYTFIVVIIRDVVGVPGPNLAWLLAAYGIAGLTAIGLMARPGDRWPKAAIVGCLSGLALAFGVLAALGFGDQHTIATLLTGVVAIVLWGATATAMPPLLQTAAMRHCPEDPDGASGLYVAAFQVGIMAGSLAGGLLYQHAGIPTMITASAALIAGALVCVVVSRGLFAVRPPTSEQ